MEKPEICPVGSRADLGAIPSSDGVFFRVWAPVARTMDVLIENSGLRFPLKLESGYFSAYLSQAHAGDRYKLSLNGGEPFPDPASRYQPEGPHGPSQIVDPSAFVWSDSEVQWPGVSLATTGG